MSKRVLLLEPYGGVADTIAALLHELDYETDVIRSGEIDGDDLQRAGYHCGPHQPGPEPD